MKDFEKQPQGMRVSAELEQIAAEAAGEELELPTVEELAEKERSGKLTAEDLERGAKGIVDRVLSENPVAKEMIESKPEFAEKRRQALIENARATLLVRIQGVNKGYGNPALVEEEMKKRVGKLAETYATKKAA